MAVPDIGEVVHLETPVAEDQVEVVVQVILMEPTNIPWLEG